MTVTPQGTTSWPLLASVPSSSRVIVALRFVMPVTTASGKLTSGMGVAVGVGWGVGVGGGGGHETGAGTHASDEQRHHRDGGYWAGPLKSHGVIVATGAY